MRTILRPSLTFLAAMTLLTGILYPAAVTGVAGLAFPVQAGGSIILDRGRAVGSELIGQPFSDPGYLWSRPSATGSVPYDASRSGGSNLGPSNPALTEAVRQRAAALREADPRAAAPLPVDLVTASASGLDPDISPAAAAWQVGRIARARGLPVNRVEAVVAAHTAPRFLGIFGEPRVNVLRVNLDLDRVTAGSAR